MWLWPSLLVYSIAAAELKFVINGTRLVSAPCPFVWKLGLPNLSPAEWESAERQRECNYAVTNNGFVRLLARDLLVGPLPDG